jgi:hypothetical protein
MRPAMSTVSRGGGIVRIIVFAAALALAVPALRAQEATTAAVPNDNAVNGVSQTTAQPSSAAGIASNPNEQSEKSTKEKHSTADQRSKPQQGKNHPAKTHPAPETAPK